MICPTCRLDNRENTRFCGRCGERLQDTSPKSDFKTQTVRSSLPGLPENRTLAGRYRVIEEVGRGGMGTVYKVLDSEIQENIALKLLNADIASDSEMISRFRNELRLARKITHKNVCRMHDLSYDGEQPFITMEFVSGESLKATIKRIGALPVEKSIELALQICRGLSEAHSMGIVHRDLKPQNIMIDGDGDAHIMDFGIARFSKDPGVTGKNAIIGTPHYMSPEQADGRDVDARSDIYSLGIILFEMLTGKLPFDGKTTLEVIVKHRTEEVPDPKKLNPHLPDPLRQIILTCLAKNPGDRYQDVKGLIDDLASLKQGEISGKDAKAIFSKKTKGTASRMRPWGWAAIGIISVLGSALIYWIVAGRDPSVRLIVPDLKARLPAWTNAVAVLPFQNLSGDPEQDYFCDGMTEQLISNIAHIKELRVPARTTVMAYKNAAKDIRQISRELEVSHIVEGSVSRSGDRIRITATLIDVATDSLLWSKNYDRTLDDVFAIQDEVSQSIASALQLELPSEILSRIKTPQPSKVEAYDLQLEARNIIRSQFMLTKRRDDFRDALEIATKAVEIDPAYAMGYVTLAYLYEVKMTILEEEGDRDKQIYYLEKAYSLDPELAAVNSALGYIYLLEGNVDKAFRFIKHGLEINPNQFDVCHLTGIFLHRIGLDSQALDFYTRAITIDQFAFFSFGNRGLIHLHLGDLEKAEADLQKSLEIQPDIHIYQKALALAYTLKKQFDTADQLLERAMQGHSQTRLDHWYRAVWHAARGDHKSALALQKSAAVYALSGMVAEAVEMMPDEQQEFWWMYSYPALAGSIIYDNLRDSARFKDFVENRKQLYIRTIQKYRLDDLEGS